MPVGEGDLYSILGVCTSSSKDDIKRAYKSLAIRHHPDKEGGNSDKFKAISEAYSTLSDDVKRSQYDGRNNPPEVMLQVFGGFGGFGGFRGFPSMHVGGIHLGGMHANMRPPPASTKMTLMISLREAYSGVRKSFKIRSTKQCTTCKTSCRMCTGSGVQTVTHSLGMMRQLVSMTCQSCGGRGGIRQSSCDSCLSAGTISSEHTLSMTMPQGVQTGHSETFPGLGDDGDLVVEVNVEDDPCLHRVGDDLHVNLTITLWESIIGTTVILPMFGGDVAVDTHATIDSGIVEPGKQYILPGMGMRFPNRAPGSLVMTFNLTYPAEKLSSDQVTQLKRDLLV